MRRFLILILFNLIHLISGSQDLLFPINPGSQNYLSGNLGELRKAEEHEHEPRDAYQFLRFCWICFNF